MTNAQEIFNNIGKTITKTADKVAKKTDDMIYVQKLYGQIRSMRRQTEDTYKYIGELMYAKTAAGEETTEDVKKYCDEIDSLKQEIKKCEVLIAEKRGSVVCQSCGAVLPKEASFCMKCGTVIDTEDGFNDDIFEDEDCATEAEPLKEAKEAVAEEE